jgi:DNA-binding Lrp family transcriptional regulator
MSGLPVSGRWSSGLRRSSSQSIEPSGGPHNREQARKVRTVNRRAAVEQLSATDREIVAVLSEHRVATTEQIATLLELPERTARYRLDRLWRLGMCGGRQPYADQGSAPYHWWPSRLADAFHRGRELPKGGEREEPQEQFLRHAAAITGLYVALMRLAPSFGWELLAFSREVEAREEFHLGDRQAAIVPDAFAVIREGDAEYHAMVEIDRGTMSLPRLGRKLSLYLDWVASGVWRERHPYVPALLVLTTTPRRVEQIVARAEERCRTEARTAPSFDGTRCIEGFVVAASDAVDRPASFGDRAVRHLNRSRQDDAADARGVRRVRANDNRRADHRRDGARSRRGSLDRRLDAVRLPPRSRQRRSCRTRRASTWSGASSGCTRRSGWAPRRSLRS